MKKVFVRDIRHGFWSCLYQESMLKCFFILLLIFVKAVHSMDLTLNFYGEKVVLRTLSLNHPALKKGATDQDLKFFQSKLSKTNWAKLLLSLNAKADKMDLDDYGKFNLLKSFVLKYAQGSQYTKKALVYAALRMDGLDAKLAVKEDFFEIYIRMKQPTDYGYSFRDEGKTYFSTNPSGVHPVNIQILRDTFYKNAGLRPFSINLKILPKIGIKIKKRPIRFYRKGLKYASTIKYNEHYVDYLNDMPILQLGGHLLEVAIENYLFSELDDSMAQWTKTMNTSDRQNFLLHMVQQAFSYKADIDYRKHEKRNTVAQSIADDFIDCEDKAVLYLFLAERYTNTRGIMLYNKDKKHVNCALEMPQNTAGYNFKYKSKKYLIAEPAFEGYDLSETDFSEEDILRSQVFLRNK
ncbi:MAG: hypothetical protein P8O20_08325 [Bacteroidia bacterium]|nr:hypothetical protein [Bacteroidia bacterium]